MTEFKKEIDYFKKPWVLVIVSNLILVAIVGLGLYGGQGLLLQQPTTLKNFVCGVFGLLAAAFFAYIVLMAILRKLLACFSSTPQAIIITSTSAEKNCWELNQVFFPKHTKQEFGFSDIVEIYQSVFLIGRGKYLPPKEIGYLHIFTKNDKMEITESNMKKEAFSKLADFLKSEVDAPYTLETTADIMRKRGDALEKAADASGNWFQRNLFDKL